MFPVTIAKMQANCASFQTIEGHLPTCSIKPSLRRKKHEEDKAIATGNVTLCVLCLPLNNETLFFGMRLTAVALQYILIY